MRPDEHVNEIVFASEILKIGRWRLPAAHARFTDSGPVRHYLFVFPRTTGWIQHAGDQPFVADPNVVTFYNQHQEYRRQRISPKGDQSDYFAMQPDIYRQVIAHWDRAAADEPDRFIPFSHGPSDAGTYWDQRMVYNHVRRTAAPDALFVEETMLNVLGRLMELAFAQRAPGSARHRDLVEHTRELIAARFAGSLTLAALGRATGSSVFHLCRVFRARTGMTIHAYRNQLRLRTALERAADPSVDLSGLALDLGFSTHSHFTHAFRQLYGLTPSDLRRQAGGRQLLRRVSPASSGRRTQ
jgi:AraC family transcriptional regulator